MLQEKRELAKQFSDRTNFESVPVIPEDHEVETIPEGKGLEGKGGLEPGSNHTTLSRYTFHTFNWLQGLCRACKASGGLPPLPSKLIPIPCEIYKSQDASSTCQNLHRYMPIWQSIYPPFTPLGEPPGYCHFLLVGIHDEGYDADAAGRPPATPCQTRRFMPTSRRIVQFSDGIPAPPGARIVYIDGAFDMFHPGHIDILKVGPRFCRVLKTSTFVVTCYL